MYVIHLVPNAPMQRIFYEIYRDRAAFDSHESQPYMQRFVAERRSCVLATNVIELRLKYAKVAPLPNPQASGPRPPAARYAGAVAGRPPGRSRRRRGPRLGASAGRPAPRGRRAPSPSGADQRQRPTSGSPGQRQVPSAGSRTAGGTAAPRGGNGSRCWGGRAVICATTRGR